MASRSLNDLHPETRRKAEKFLDLANKEGIDVLIYCTYRSFAEQLVLYLQGRYYKFGLTLDELNDMRKTVGLWKISEKEARRRVTNAKPGRSFHQYGLAFDCVPMHAGKPAWNDIESYRILGKIGEEVGLEWAGNWKTFREYPHFQDTVTWEIIAKKGRVSDELIKKSYTGIFPESILSKLSTV